ncbi:hypothetical protein B0T26DRAFT_672735 [Lasiosphaeria miniovina]|uniref:Myb/SANT-like domain-containing protein n=1 Tax=Lasiosphaeria miniovina TaxID=1954250 RepID=A0AA40B5T0_9PEZI|nr:uncharacterized protein B0T26DRAFT_672735 [Lasiosphaeria miniovina]KAK0728154.1 hypothetical protein B0T26DRAFT_672735 [Lasiosphaeria miniovina]
MGGKVWSKEEEKIFWRDIIPFSPKRLGIDRANPEKTWTALAVDMTEIMNEIQADSGEEPRRNYTYLRKLTVPVEHFFQNARNKNYSPFAHYYARRYIEQEQEDICNGLAVAPDVRPSARDRMLPPSHRTKSNAVSTIRRVDASSAARKPAAKITKASISITKKVTKELKTNVENAFSRLNDNFHEMADLKQSVNYSVNSNEKGLAQLASAASAANMLNIKTKINAFAQKANALPGVKQAINHVWGREIDTGYVAQAPTPN